MVSKAQAWRRWIGLVFLALAFGMLVWGQTVLKSRLSGMVFVFYWLGCFLFTFLALMTSALDIWLIRRKQRKERTNLVKNTFTKLESLDDDGNSGEKHTSNSG